MHPHPNRQISGHIRLREGQARRDLVREVPRPCPAPRRPHRHQADRDEDRARLDRHRPNPRRLLHEAQRAGVARREADRPSPRRRHPRRRPWRDVRGRRCRVVPARLPRTRLEASTRRDYRSALERPPRRRARPARGSSPRLSEPFGDLRLDEITSETIERWRANAMAEERLPRRTAVKAVAILHGIFARARNRPSTCQRTPLTTSSHSALATTPAASTSTRSKRSWRLFGRPRTNPSDKNVTPSQQDGAIYLTAALTGLRLGEVLALRVRDVDFDGETIRVLQSVDPIEGVGTRRAATAAPSRWSRRSRRHSPVSSARPVHQPRRPRLPERARTLARRLRPPPPLQGRADPTPSSAAPLPRPAPHFRHARPREGRKRPRAPGVDGACRRSDDRQIHALPAPEGRRPSTGSGVRHAGRRGWEC